MGKLTKTPEELIQELQDFRAEHFWEKEANSMLADAAAMIEVLNWTVNQMKRDAEDQPLEYHHDGGMDALVYGVQIVEETDTGVLVRGKIRKKEEIQEHDPVKHPAHYCGKIETIDFIRDKLTPEAFRGYCIGNVLKYLSRYDKKEDPKQDLQKAEVYLGWAIEAMETETEEENGRV